MKKKIIAAVVVSLLAIPFNSMMALADQTSTPSTTAATTAGTTDITTPISTTSSDTVTTDQTTSGSQTDSSLPPITDAGGSVVSPGTLPDSPFYWLSNLIQKLELALTFDPAKKAALAEQQALQQLADAEEMLKQGKSDLAQKALTEYSNKLAQAQQFLQKIIDPNSDAAKALIASLTQTNAKNIKVLSGLLDKLPPQAAQKVALNVVRSLEKAVQKGMKGEDLQVLKANLQKMATGQTITKTDDDQDQAAANNGEKHKAEIAKEREKGQQGTRERTEHQAVTQPASAALSSQQTVQREDGQSEGDNEEIAPPADRNDDHHSDRQNNAHRDQKNR